MKELEEFIKGVAEWQDNTFPAASSLSKLAHLIEEIVEVKEAIVSGDKKQIRREFADCFLLLFGAAAKNGLSVSDIYEAMKEKMEINKLREWGEPDENGVVRHIKK